jgi:type IV pilus assembly protein PilA
MLLQNLRAKVGARLNGDKEAGFTLIELLVVMLILGILAAIALPAFFNQKDKASDAKAKEYVHSAQVAIETWGTENGGLYPNPSGEGKTLKGELERIEPTLSSATGLTAAPVGTGTSANKGYEITVTGTAGHTFTVKRETNGTLGYTCLPVGEGGCPSTGNWSNG